MIEKVKQTKGFSDNSHDKIREKNDWMIGQIKQKGSTEQ